MIKLPAFKHDYYKCISWALALATLLARSPASTEAATSKSRLCLQIKPQLMIKSHNRVNYSIFIRASLCCAFAVCYSNITEGWIWSDSGFTGREMSQSEPDGWKSHKNTLLKKIITVKSGRFPKQRAEEGRVCFVFKHTGFTSNPREYCRLFYCKRYGLLWLNFAKSSIKSSLHLYFVENRIQECKKLSCGCQKFMSSIMARHTGACIFCNLWLYTSLI